MLKKCMLQFPKAQTCIFKCLVLRSTVQTVEQFKPNQQFKPKYIKFNINKNSKYSHLVRWKQRIVWHFNFLTTVANKFSGDQLQSF